MMAQWHTLCTETCFMITITIQTLSTEFSFILFDELQRSSFEIKSDNLTASNSVIITLDFTVLKNRIW